jgi:hypothetical protein
VLFTHHFRQIDEATGALMGALSDLQAAWVKELVEGADRAALCNEAGRSASPLAFLDAEGAVVAVATATVQIRPQMLQDREHGQGLRNGHPSSSSLRETGNTPALRRRL